MTFIFCLKGRIASKDWTVSIFVVLYHSHLKDIWNMANMKVEFLPTSMTSKLQAIDAVHRTGTLITCMNNIVYITLRYEDPKLKVTLYLRFLSYHAVFTVTYELDVHESMHCDIIMNTTEMQLYRLIYYS
jgi:hypothetical protein